MSRQPVRVVGVVVVLMIAALAWFARKHSGPRQAGIHSEVVEAHSASAETKGPLVAGCPSLPADNVWNTPIDSLPKDRKSSAYTDSIGPLQKLHADFGSDLKYGIPFTEIPSRTRRVPVLFDYRDESDLGHYPIPPDAPVEGGSEGTGDRHVLVLDPTRCLLFELYDAHLQGDGTWKAGSGIRMDLTSNALRPDGKTSADAAGLPILPGLVRYDEVEAGEIRHALRFTIPHTQNTYVWPARHKASKNGDPNLAPLGARFRLRADFDVTRFSRQNQVILNALKHYGMFLADNGSAIFLSGVSDKRWNSSDLGKLGAVKAEDFEVVDESDWQMLADSGRVDPLALKHQQ